ncbi:MAG: glycosyltransferase 87 family protein [Hyphomicrobiales bacterium]
MNAVEAFRSARPFAAVAACGAALIALSLVAWHAQWIDSFGLFIPVVLAQGCVYGLAAWMLIQDGPRGASDAALLAIILGVAAMLRVIAFATPPNFLSTDLYRYIWDGRVQAAGINPFRYVPADPALAALRDEAIYSHINRVDYAPTIYPPFAQMVFFAVTRLGESVAVMRLGMLGFEVAAIAVLATLLRRLRLPTRRLALYLWHPLPVWEFACGAHVDAAMMAMALLALLAATAGRRGLAGALLAAATLAKFLPLVIAPAIYRRWDWKMPAAFACVAALLYLPYLGVGWKVFGFLGGYLSDERLSTGDGPFPLSLLHRLGLGASAATIGYAVLVLAVLGSLAARALARDGDAPPALAASLATAAMALVSPHYAWYFAWLVPFICFRPRPSLIYLTVAAFYLYVADWPLTLNAGLIIYGPFLAMLLLEQRYLLLPRLQEGSIS